MSHKELADRIQGWFTTVAALPGWVRTKSPVWAAMRDNLRVLGNWKNAPRGNPEKGFKVMRQKTDVDE